MASIDRISLRAVPSLAVIAFALSACASPAGTPMASAPITNDSAHVTRFGTALTRQAPRGSQDLYIGNCRYGGKSMNDRDAVHDGLLSTVALLA